MNIITWFLIALIFIGLAVYTSGAPDWSMFNALFLVLGLVCGLMALVAWRSEE